MDDGKRAISLQLSTMASASLERKLEGGGLGGGRAEISLWASMGFNRLWVLQGAAGRCFLVFLKPFYTVS